MRRVGLNTNASFEDWRAAARQLLADGVEPHEIDWSNEDSLSLFGTGERAPSEPSASIRVPRDFFQLATLASLHRDDARFAVLYRLLWRIQREPRLLEDALDHDVDSVTRMAKPRRSKAASNACMIRDARGSDAFDTAMSTCPAPGLTSFA